MIPEHKGVPAHWHYDVRYVVVAGRDEDFAVSEESLDLAWRDIAAVAEDTSADESLRRMAAKWLARTDKPLSARLPPRDFALAPPPATAGGGWEGVPPVCDEPNGPPPQPVPPAPTPGGPSP